MSKVELPQIPRRLSLTPLIMQGDGPNCGYQFPSQPPRMTWTSSSLKQFRRCKRKWFWKYLMRLSPKGAMIDRNLFIGKQFHEGLGEWYRGKRSDMRQIALRRASIMRGQTTGELGWYDQDELDKLHQAVDTYAGMLIGYAQAYEQDRREWNIRRETIESTFKVNMGRFDFAGRIDLIAKAPKDWTYGGAPAGGEWFICEHKTSSSNYANQSYMDRLRLDTQVRGYLFGARYGLGIHTDFVLYDVVKKCKLRRKSCEDLETFSARVANDYLSRPDFYFHREPLPFPDSALDEFVYELHQTHSEYERIMQQGSQGDFSWLTDPTEPPSIELTTFSHKNPRAWPANDGACQDYFRLCEFHTLCVEGLDAGTSANYRQREELHEELTDEAADD